VNNIDRQLADLQGVEQVHVDLPTGKITIELSPDDPATRERLVKAIADSGFTLERIEMPK
jgi:copper chaperone CopZ